MLELEKHASMCDQEIQRQLRRVEVREDNPTVG